MLTTLRASCVRALPLAARGAAAAQPPRPAAAAAALVCRASSSSGAADGGSGGGGGGDGARQIAPPDVRELARLAHIAVTDEEVADWGPKIEGIVEWFGQLQEVDVEGVPPALRADVEGETPLRADEVHSCEALGEMLAQAADREGAFVRVPKIATGSDDPPAN